MVCYLLETSEVGSCVSTDTFSDFSAVYIRMDRLLLLLSVKQIMNPFSPALRH